MRGGEEQGSRAKKKNKGISRCDSVMQQRKQGVHHLVHVSTEEDAAFPAGVGACGGLGGVCPKGESMTSRPTTKKYSCSLHSH